MSCCRHVTASAACAITSAYGHALSCLHASNVQRRHCAGCTHAGSSWRVLSSSSATPSASSWRGAESAGVSCCCGAPMHTLKQASLVHAVRRHQRLARATIGLGGRNGRTLTHLQVASNPRQHSPRCPSRLGTPTGRDDPAIHWSPIKVCFARLANVPRQPCERHHFRFGVRFGVRGGEEHGRGGP
eukprot:359650-Chlamydomonas_euryale.AAC.2